MEKRQSYYNSAYTGNEPLEATDNQKTITFRLSDHPVGRKAAETIYSYGNENLSIIMGVKSDEYAAKPQASDIYKEVVFNSRYFKTPEQRQEVMTEIFNLIINFMKTGEISGLEKGVLRPLKETTDEEKGGTEAKQEAAIDNSLPRLADMFLRPKRASDNRYRPKYILRQITDKKKTAIMTEQEFEKEQAIIVDYLADASEALAEAKRRMERLNEDTDGHSNIACLVGEENELDSIDYIVRELERLYFNVSHAGYDPYFDYSIEDSLRRPSRLGDSLQRRRKNRR